VIEPVFMRCVKLIEIHKENDSDFVQRAANLIAAIVTTVKEQSIPLINNSNLVTQMIQILRGKSINKSQVFSLIGDIHPYIFDDPENQILSELFRLLTASLRFSESNLSLAGFEDQNNISVCNNACWALGEIAVTCTLKSSQNQL
jgi:type III secretion system FlhB-like substrate exporter